MLLGKIWAMCLSMQLFDLPRDDGRVIFTNSHQKKLFVWNRNLKNFTAPVSPETIRCIFMNKPMILVDACVRLNQEKNNRNPQIEKKCVANKKYEFKCTSA